MIFFQKIFIPAQTFPLSGPYYTKSDLKTAFLMQKQYINPKKAEAPPAGAPLPHFSWHINKIADILSVFYSGIRLRHYFTMQEPECQSNDMPRIPFCLHRACFQQAVITSPFLNISLLTFLPPCDILTLFVLTPKGTAAF